jgi:hypothetical protein
MKVVYTTNKTQEWQMQTLLQRQILVGHKTRDSYDQMKTKNQA